MKIKNISVKRVQIPLKVRFSQANNSPHLSDSVILRLETQNGTIGYGEACPRPYVTGEDAFTVIRDITSLEDKLKALDFSALESIKNLVCSELPEQIGLSAICALELAMLDAWSREYQTPLTEALGGNPHLHVHYSGIVPMAQPEKLNKILPVLRRFQFKQLKLKVGTDLTQNIASTQMIRHAFGAKMPLCADANASWSYHDALEQIPALMKFGVRSFEQIFDPSMDRQMGEITSLLGINVRIMADESATSFESVKQLIEKKHCNHLNIKISKHGGIFNTLRIYEMAKQHSIPCQLGAHFGETSILTAAGLIVSSVAQDLTAYEGGYGTNLLDSDVTYLPLSFNKNGKIGTIKQKLTPLGLGVNVSDKLYNKLTLVAA